MAIKRWSRCFILEDPSLGFLKLFQIVAIVHEDILRSVVLMFGASKLLAMAKNIGGFCSIVIGKMFFQIINRSIVK
jgi:hypothetical protein